MGSSVCEALEDAAIDVIWHFYFKQEEGKMLRSKVT
jgi:hypothetical protein